MFYKNSLRAISKSKNVTLKLNETILKIKEYNTYYLVVTNRGEYLAKNILDARYSEAYEYKAPGRSINFMIKKSY